MTDDKQPAELNSVASNPAAKPLTDAQKADIERFFLLTSPERMVEMLALMNHAIYHTNEAFSSLAKFTAISKDKRSPEKARILAAQIKVAMHGLIDGMNARDVIACVDAYKARN